MATTRKTVVPKKPKLVEEPALFQDAKEMLNVITKRANKLSYMNGSYVDAVTEAVRLLWRTS